MVYEATRRIKADALLRSIPIIAVTSYIMCGNLLVRANCWRKFASTCNSSSLTGHNAMSHLSLRRGASPTLASGRFQSAVTGGSRKFDRGKIVERPEGEIVAAR